MVGGLLKPNFSFCQLANSKRRVTPEQALPSVSGVAAAPLLLPSTTIKRQLKRFAGPARCH